MKSFLFAIAAAIIFAGCCNVEICREGGHDMCYISTSEWVVIDCIPLFAGNPNGRFFLIFQDTANIETNTKLLDKAVNQGNYIEVLNPVNYTTEESMIPFIFKRKLFHTSAELVMKKAED